MSQNTRGMYSYGIYKRYERICDPNTLEPVRKSHGISTEYIHLEIRVLPSGNPGSNAAESVRNFHKILAEYIRLKISIHQAEIHVISPLIFFPPFVPPPPSLFGKQLFLQVEMR